MIRMPRDVKLERWEHILISITKIGYWLVPILCFGAVISIGVFYRFFGFITKAEWNVLVISSNISLGLWMLALLSRVLLFLARKKENQYQSQLKEPDDSMDSETLIKIARVKERYLKTHARIKKFGELYLFLLRLSLAVILFELLFIFYLEILYKVIL